MPYEFHTRRRIEFADTDMAGIVHFARFFIFMETAEHEFLRSLGTSVATRLDNMQLGWPRLAASCEYLSPAKFEEVLDIRVSVARKGNKSMTYHFEFRRGEVLIARGQMISACCLVGAEGKLNAIPIPDFIADQIQEAPKDMGRID
ncbi:MAG: acyl-CoA thioesterase [candidate division KSB1 bacterium]|nr:acyl-CoA thioesterase [candidate division KSB1 bacterium]MDZ7366847.1 acyl-CoA thioesterase [candidate division KSB1 bacterium]MDZ7405146.1 acyl-CoA thioesterase [candidate division KSB1 bacterium]